MIARQPIVGCGGHTKESKAPFVILEKLHQLFRSLEYPIWLQARITELGHILLVEMLYIHSVSAPMKGRFLSVQAMHAQLWRPPT